MISRLFDDTLWIYTAILGSILGAVALAYLKDTKLGIWGYKKFDQLVDWLRDRYGWTWLDQPATAWRDQEPELASKIDELESRIARLESSKK
jgi:hypothetical protein